MELDWNFCDGVKSRHLITQELGLHCWKCSWLLTRSIDIQELKKAHRQFSSGVFSSFTFFGTAKEGSEAHDPFFSWRHSWALDIKDISVHSKVGVAPINPFEGNIKRAPSLFQDYIFAKCIPKMDSSNTPSKPWQGDNLHFGLMLQRCVKTA